MGATNSRQLCRGDMATSPSASHEEATRLHDFQPLERLHGYTATNSRQPWRGDMATSFSASHGRQFRASQGEATQLHAFPPAMEATSSALALERLPKKVTLGRLLERCVDLKARK